MSAPAMDLSGRRLGHIRIDRVLGRGGMGDVYEGFDEKLMRRVALKALHRDRRLDDEARTRLVREARTLSQLDHPNICRIHDYIEEGDSDVLVLELIEGRTLQQAIEEGLSRAEKLRIALAIAEVLVAAHRAGIVHRDLKPENVMLTKAGVVKVLDFGLARWVERAPTSRRSAVRMRAVAPDPEAARDRTQPYGESPAGETAAGMTVGTPLFMSPEQARGEPLTPASDLYSFGLLLQTLFTSSDPYPPEASGMEVMVLAARGESLPPTGVEHDIAALIGALKALAPTDRPTAAETAARLQRIIDKPKRVARRVLLAAALVLVILGGWRYTVDLQRERTAALAAKQDAIRRRGQAEDLVGFMVGDLRKKLEAVGRLDILDSAATKALDYSRSLDPNELTTADLIRNAKALHQIGDVRIAQGRLGDAMPIFRRAMDLAALAEKRSPGDPEAQLAVGTSHFWIGNAYRLQGDLPHALDHLTRYLQVGEKLAARDPASEPYQMEVAYGNSMVAMIHESQGQLPSALQHYRTALEIKRAQSEVRPNDLDRRYDLSLTLNHVGVVLQRMGDLRGAADYYREEERLLSDLVARDPKQTQWIERLATNQSFTAALAEFSGDDATGLAHRRAGLSLERKLHLIDSSNTKWTRNLAVTLMAIGEIERRNGNLQAARTAVGESEELLRGLLVIDPSRDLWKRTLGIVLVARARVLCVARQDAAALSVLNEAGALLANPSDTKTRRWAAEAQIARGDVLRDQGSASGSRAAWTQARDIIVPVARNSTDPQLLETWARSLLRLGETAEADPLLRRLAAIGYRPRDLTASS